MCLKFLGGTRSRRASTIIIARHGKYSEIRGLADKVMKRCTGEDKSKEFLPRNALDELVTEQNVRLALRETELLQQEPDSRKQRAQIKRLEDVVLRGGCRKIFLILVLMTDKKQEYLSYLKDFERSEVNDTALPLEFKPADEKDEEVWYGFSMEPGREEQVKFSGDWDRNEGTLFTDKQWKIVVPAFGNGKFRFQLIEKQILPFLRIATTPSSSGFFGEVSRAEIHSNHIGAFQGLRVNPGLGEPWISVAIKKAKHDEALMAFFDKEADNLQGIKDYDSPHLIQAIAAYQQGNDRCLIFPWAYGGNLCNYWENNPRDRHNPEALRWIIAQFVGLVSVLDMLHNNNVRHGDLKPENILWFKEGGERGMLKIADLGLTRFHDKDLDTKARDWKQQGTNTPSGTKRYEPPEMDKHRGTDKARPRRYDVWSMGCILLESLVWLMYGFEPVRIFRNHTPYFWTYTTEPGKGRKYRVDPYVESCMHAMLKQLEDNTAYKDLLELVLGGLLVVELEASESSPKCREHADVLYEKVQSIQRRCQSSSRYLSLVDPKLKYPDSEIDKNQRPPVITVEKDGMLAVADLTDPSSSQRRLPQSQLTASVSDPEGHDIPRVILRQATADVNSNSSTQETSISDKQEQSKKLNDDWESIPDDGFAARLFEGLVDWESVKPSQEELYVTLCSHCRDIDSTRLFSSDCNIIDLRFAAPVCDLCKQLLEALEGHGFRPPQIVALRQNGRVVGVENGPNLLSIYADPGSNVSQGAQLGLPKLVEQGSPQQFTLLKEWIRVCDTTHDSCRRRYNDEEGSSSSPTMPTRLVELGEPLRLVESASIEPSRYAALSHCWGKLTEEQKLCTYKRNMAKFKKSIEFRRLPRTFRDAVAVARGIGIRYLWIDSLCVVQDDEADWESESARMEHVFSAAYCTIAASSARSSVEGFLKPRLPRKCVQLQTPTAGTLYVCPNIDDFRRDVELGELNSRGWVLQERALSQRSIFYTSTQVYWECGDGVHCETLGRLKNSKAAFLGDANFPNSALEYYRDGRQMLVQDLYERYSGLAFSKNSDRPVAILGLQERLRMAFKTKAGYGFFAPYFARLLLWKRRDHQRITRIVTTSRRAIPTWSWFSKVGPIKYMDLGFTEINWATGQDFENPFNNTSRRSGVAKEAEAGTDGEELSTLRGLARRLSMTRMEMLVHITIDEQREFEVGDLRCVVIGRDKDGGGSRLVSPKYHVLVIAKGGRTLGENVYERVGAGSLKPEHVADKGSWVSIV